ncbi:hypothetical protein M0811_13536 [Anaeramoeba ignava]|uniref:Uncharacterized protein n=1 Tax=Anaeramoeba ignava TaxID=1746090 RepID=A0A9Q0L6W5_ANAIG|nr:hypothetical protein M0811_13536 [Anaeramoeba ignava]
MDIPKPSNFQAPSNYHLQQLLYQLNEICFLSLQKNQKSKMESNLESKIQEKLTLKENIIIACLRIFDDNFHPTSVNKKIREFLLSIDPEPQMLVLHFLIDQIGNEELPVLRQNGIWKILFSRYFYHHFNKLMKSQEGNEILLQIHKILLDYFSYILQYDPNAENLEFLTDFMISNKKQLGIVQDCFLILTHNLQTNLESTQSLFMETKGLETISQMVDYYRIIQEEYNMQIKRWEQEKSMDEKNETKLIAMEMPEFGYDEEQFYQTRKVAFNVLDMILFSDKMLAFGAEIETLVMALFELLLEPQVKNYSLHLLSGFLRKTGEFLHKLSSEKSEYKYIVSLIGEMLKYWAAAISQGDRHLQNRFVRAKSFEVVCGFLKHDVLRDTLINEIFRILIALLLESTENQGIFNEQIGWENLCFLACEITVSENGNF